jgi:hypothetical protein
MDVEHLGETLTDASVVNVTSMTDQALPRHYRELQLQLHKGLGRSRQPIKSHQSRWTQDLKPQSTNILFQTIGMQCQRVLTFHPPFAYNNTTLPVSSHPALPFEKDPISSNHEPRDPTAQ